MKNICSCKNCNSDKYIVFITSANYTKILCTECWYEVSSSTEQEAIDMWNKQNTFNRKEKIV